MFYAVDDQATNSARVIWGFPTKAERDSALSANHPGEWRPVSAADAKALAINSKRVNLLGTSERPGWLRNAYFRRWNLRRFANGISVSRPELVAVSI